MVNRFNKLFELQENLYIEGSPLIIKAGALLKDTETGSVVVQLKFQNVSEKNIKAVKVGLTTYDVSGVQLNNVPEYQYLDINITKGKVFGTNKAILIPDSVCRSFKISSLFVIFNDNTMWSLNGVGLITLPIGKDLESELKDEELIKQYRIETSKNALYIPQESNGLWQCSCGEWNKDSICTKCQISKNVVFSSLNIEALTELLTKRIEIEKIEEERRVVEETKRQEELRIKREKTKSALKKYIKLLFAIITPSVILASIFTQWLLPKIIQPAISYNKAEKMLSAGQYDDAEKEFQSLGEYRDAFQMVIETRYQKACWLMENGQKENAITIFAELNNYTAHSEDIIEIIEKSNSKVYTMAQELLNEKKYDAAIATFSALDNYKDSIEKVNESKLQKALSLADKNKFIESIRILEELDESLDTDNYLASIKYKYANMLLSQGEFDLAKSIYEDIVDYENSIKMASECDYQKAVSLFDVKDYEGAIETFTKIGKYKDSSSKILQCKYQLALTNMTNSQYSIALSLFEELCDYEDTEVLILEAKYEVAKEYISKGNYSGDYKSAILILDELGDYKNSALYRKLIDESKVLVYQRNDGSRYWYLSVYTVIDIDSCTLKLKAQEVRSNDRLRDETQKYTIDYLTRFEEWKIENGKYLMIFEGANPTKDRLCYREWTIMSNWDGIHSQTLEHTGEILGEPGEFVDTYTRITDENVAKKFVERTRNRKDS